MPPLLGLLFALRLGLSPAQSEPPPSISVRAEARAAAAESAIGPAALLDLSAAPHSPEWPVLPSTPGVAPIFLPHRPEDWVAAVARQLNVRDRSLTQAAMQATMWVLAMPVRVQVSPSRVYVTVRFRAF